MKTTLMLLAGCVGCLLAGCASPQGGANPNFSEEPITGKGEGVAPKPMAAPMPPALSGQNLRDMRSPQGVTIPGPPVSPQPAPQPGAQP